MEVRKVKKKETKQQYEPWDKKEQSVMMLSINQAKLKKDTQLAEIAKLEAGLKGIDVEIETNIAMKRMELKAAGMALDDVCFDKEHKITIHRIECRIGELQDEIARAKINIRAFETQLKQGKPKQEVAPMPEEPIVDEALKEKAEKEVIPEEEPKEETPKEIPDVGASDDQPKAEETTDEQSPNEGGEKAE